MYEYIYNILGSCSPPILENCSLNAWSNNRLCSTNFANTASRDKEQLALKTQSLFFQPLTFCCCCISCIGNSFPLPFWKVYLFSSFQALTHSIIAMQVRATRSRASKSWMKESGSSFQRCFISCVMFSRRAGFCNWMLSRKFVRLENMNLQERFQCPK